LLKNRLITTPGTIDAIILLDCTINYYIKGWIY